MFLVFDRPSSQIKEELACDLMSVFPQLSDPSGRTGYVSIKMSHKAKKKNVCLSTNLFELGRSVGKSFYFILFFF